MPAHAVPVKCTNYTYGPLCTFNYGAGGRDLILVEGPFGAERIRVVCSTENDWKSVGPNTIEFVDGVVSMWCGN